MKTLYLVRHAKSDWSDAALSDRRRPLSARGRRDAPRMARRLARRYRRPDLIVSSPALRALATAEIFARELGYRRRHIVVDPRLYAHTARDLLRLVHGLDDELERVMLFGHDPELSSLAGGLCARIAHLPTCAVARLKFDVEHWRAVAAATLSSARLRIPRSAARP